MKGSWVVTFLIIPLSCSQGTAIRYENGALPPEQALASYQIEDGFKIELIASEPLIASPVDMEIDEYGNCYVVEMPGYPLDKTHTGRIKLLRDTDGDGVMDESLLFADNLMFPNGVLRWRNGIIVTDAPNILYLEDTDGDGRSDKRDTLLTGFSLSNPHVNVNNPVYGLDNWIYLAHYGHIGTRKYKEEFGDLGAEIVFPFRKDSPRLPRNAGARSVRFRPDGSALEMRASRSQFGHTFDPWGHHFLTHNQNHIYQEVLAAPYVNRNKSLFVANATASVSDHGEATEVFQITTNPDRQLFTPVGLTTSTSGITAYTGGGFPDPFNDGALFVAESVSNLIHVDLLEDKGATYTAHRHRKDKEFLASTDAWARPVNMYVGPDGALYVLDYYRRIIEHPEWMSDDAIAAGGLYDGVNMGRIYRVSPVGAAGADWTRGLKLGTFSVVELVGTLAHVNSWWRLHAQRLLIDRKDMKAVPLLESLLRQDSSRYGRLHALWTLEGLGVLKPEHITVGLHDAEGAIRENAIRLAERYLQEGLLNDDLLAALYALEQDPDARVRYQLLCTLGWLSSVESHRVRERVLFADIEDSWVQLAALSAGDLRANSLLQTVLVKYHASPGYESLVHKLAAMIGNSDDESQIRSLIQRASAIGVPAGGWQPGVLAGIAEGLQRNEAHKTILASEQPRLINTFFKHADSRIRNASSVLLELAALDANDKWTKEGIAYSLEQVANKKLTADERAASVRFLRFVDATPYRDILQALVIPEEDPEVQQAALTILGSLPGEDLADYLLGQWERMTPEIRDAALETFLTDKNRVRRLLDAVEKGSVSKSAVGWTRSVRLMQTGDDELRAKAQRLFTRDDAAEVNKAYEAALKIAGKADRGRAVFQTHCTICHQVRGELGVAYGPDLGTVHNWKPEDLMANILEPSLSIAPGFDLWQLELHTGERMQGMIKNETSTAIELATAPGQLKTVNRAEIHELQGVPLSPMPSFGGVLSHEEMADLIAFLRNSHGINAAIQ